ncbi:Protein of unknown function (DUF4244) [Actinoalloteichus cyanogriseus DSM 43889]|uniref:DUF4244 domain-containing protein n=1 Tax=Actinoalloteichus caeruleus DSM 43889 TaxID=1120930 RepID=A0ABT1JJL8_ACTCY|nr:Protein of unknown function (DUF4244) [Actinoalloteichus caeruleus DSM 43889]
MSRPSFQGPSPLARLYRRLRQPDQPRSSWPSWHAARWVARSRTRAAPGRHRSVSPSRGPAQVLPASATTGEEGMSTAEYAIGTVAAAALAAVLYTLVTGDSVASALASLVQRALSVGF